MNRTVPCPDRRPEDDQLPTCVHQPMDIVPCCHQTTSLVRQIPIFSSFMARRNARATASKGGALEKQQGETEDPLHHI